MARSPAVGDAVGEGHMGLTYCCAEDRKGAEIGLKLLVLSVARHSPGVPLHLHRPHPLPEFVAWLRRFPQVRLFPDPLPGASDWNTKPHALLPALAGDDDVAVWLDSDLMLAGDPRPWFAGLGPGEIGLAEEPASHPDPGMALRTRGWGFTPGPDRGITINSCVIRVTPRHRRLLERWKECMARDDYRAWQARPVGERPPAMKSDQDVLNALLGAEEFQDLRVRLLRSGREVVHCGGALAYGLAERVAGLAGPHPLFLHAISVKPWMILNPGQALAGRMWWWRRLNQELSPYVAHARRYRDAVDEPTRWMDWRTPTGTALRLLGLGHWALRGLPVTAAATVVQRLGLLRGA